MMIFQVATGVGSPGVKIEACWELVEQIRVACPRLKFRGLSGVTGGVGGAGASRDGLDALLLARQVVADRLGMAPQVRFDCFGCFYSAERCEADDSRLDALSFTASLNVVILYNSLDFGRVFW